MAQFTFVTLSMHDDAITQALEGLSYTSSPGASVPQLHDGQVLYYMPGISVGAVQHTEWVVDLGDVKLQYFETYSQLPICSGHLTVVPERWLENNNGIFSSKEFMSPESQAALELVKKLHRLAYDYRRPGDTVMVPVDVVYTLAAQSGEYKEETTAKQVSDQLFSYRENPYLESYTPVPPVYGDTDYSNNQRMIVSYPFCYPHDVPLVCALMISKPPEHVPGFIGELKKRDVFTLILKSIGDPVTGDYGTTRCYRLTDTKGNKAIWWTKDETFEKLGKWNIGDAKQVKATPVSHETDTMVTKLSRVGVVK